MEIDDKIGQEEDKKILAFAKHAIIQVNHSAQLQCRQEAAHPKKE
jgi:hypothetical protein